MKKKPLILIGISLVPLLVVGLGAGTACVSRRPVEVGLIEGRLRPCPSASNCVCSEPDSGAASVQPLAFEGDPQQALRSLVDHLGTEKGAKMVEAGDAYVHAVYYTPLLKFADDVEFRLDPRAKLIHVRSASRVGRSDLGANRVRIERLRRRWMPPR